MKSQSANNGMRTGMTDRDLGASSVISLVRRLRSYLQCASLSIDRLLAYMRVRVISRLLNQKTSQGSNKRMIKMGDATAVHLPNHLRAQFNETNQTLCRQGIVDRSCSKMSLCRSTGSGNQIAPESDIFKRGRGDGLPRELSLVAV
ncbi:hypothetical protein PILCRDRAFT_723924 [Piloderma croceum F 1598]|uniref:Uncharacterized protein n=1 Tax=Piloderma croceum (strain F 1598) TaxID=765440 RepID=A0A0C3B8N3_PILCF|nr:hypothetical protein PILCRDRAFT_723924 [Piloderma croceum F 1598]